MTYKHFSFVRMTPLMLLILCLALFFYFQIYDYLTFSALKAHRQTLLIWTLKNHLLAVFSFMAVYIISVAISIPGAVFITVLAGFLFGPIWGTFYVVISATIGAAIIFLATRTALAGLLTTKAGPATHQFEKGFQRNAFSYLLFLRFIPLFPFWLINIVPAILNVRFSTFILATFIGIIPGSFVFVLIGNGVNSVFTKNSTPDISVISKPEIILPLIALGVLSLMPILYKKYIAKRKSTHGTDKD
jgi:uncharacterized membrane protein YdjX (TVP38/TMEM64 family)